MYTTHKLLYTLIQHIQLYLLHTHLYTCTIHTHYTALVVVAAADHKLI